jgi:hypothetical protein
MCSLCNHPSLKTKGSDNVLPDQGYSTPPVIDEYGAMMESSIEGEIEKI